MYVTPTSANVPACPNAGALYGLGLFESGADWTQWGWQEWLTAGVGIYALFAITSTTKRAAGTVRRKVRAAARA